MQETKLLTSYFLATPIEELSAAFASSSSEIVLLLESFDVVEKHQSCNCVYGDDRPDEVNAVALCDTTDDSISIKVSEYGLNPFERIVEHECFEDQARAEALTILGRIYEGVLDQCGDLYELVERSDRRAAGYYLQAARVGSEEATFRLGGLLYRSDQNLFPLDGRSIGLHWLSKVPYGLREGQDVEERLKLIHRFYGYGFVFDEPECARELYLAALENRKYALMCLTKAAAERSNLDANYWLARYKEKMLGRSGDITYASVASSFMDNALRGHKKSIDWIRAEGMEGELAARLKYFVGN
ncbi:MAG: hypothetical protein ACREGD_05160 [Candidatus Saccharimonadales bacterium]